jgi:hypothetical protein
MRSLKQLANQDHLLDTIRNTLVFSWNELIGLIMMTLGVSLSTAQRRLKRWDILHPSLNLAPGSQKWYAKMADIEKNAGSDGLWYFHPPDGLAGPVIFSRWGDIRETLVHLIQRKPGGLTVKEAIKILYPSVKDTLRLMYESGQLERIKFGREHVYLHPELWKDQIARRNLDWSDRKIHMDGTLREEVFHETGTMVRAQGLEVLEEAGVEDPLGSLDIFIASLLQPWFQGEEAATALDRALKNNIYPLFRSFFDFANRTPPSHAEISKVRRQVGPEGYLKMMIHLAQWFVKESGLNEIDIDVILDESRCYQSHGDKRGKKIHLACLSQIGIPIAFEFVEDGKSNDLHTLRPLLLKVKDFIDQVGIRVRYVLADGLYDKPEFYSEVLYIFGAEPITHRRCGGKKSPEGDGVEGVVEFFLRMGREREEIIRTNEEKDRNRVRGRRRAVPPPPKVVLSDPGVQVSMMRRFPRFPYASEERKRIYGSRTLIERLFGLQKQWLHLDGLCVRGLVNREMHLASVMCCSLVHAVMMAHIGIPHRALQIRSFGI